MLAQTLSENLTHFTREDDEERPILCLTSRTTVTSARILEEDACHRVRNLCVFSLVQKGTPGLTHIGCVLQRVSLGAPSDVTVVLGVRQSIGCKAQDSLGSVCEHSYLSYSFFSFFKFSFQIAAFGSGRVLWRR